MDHTPSRPPLVWYTYKDFMTGKIKRTRGTFSGYTEPGGILNVRYAIFRNVTRELLVPPHCMTKETLSAIAAHTGERS